MSEAWKRQSARCGAGPVCCPTRMRKEMPEIIHEIMKENHVEDRLMRGESHAKKTKGMRMANPNTRRILNTMIRSTVASVESSTEALSAVQHRLTLVN